MLSFRQIRRPCAAALLIVAMTLGACGTGADSPVVTLARGLVANVAGGEVDEDANLARTAAENPAVLRQVVDQFSDISLILFELPASDGVAFLTEVGRNGNAVTWQGSDGVSVILTQTGVLRGTRGLGADLMAADPRSTEATLRARRAGAVDRLPIYLEGDIREVREVHRCSLQIDGREDVRIVDRMVTLTRATESCVYSGGRYENTYWLDAGNAVIRSQQWITPEAGHLWLTRLN